MKIKYLRNPCVFRIMFFSLDNTVFHHGVNLPTNLRVYMPTCIRAYVSTCLRAHERVPPSGKRA